MQNYANNKRRSPEARFGNDNDAGCPVYSETEPGVGVSFTLTPRPRSPKRKTQLANCQIKINDNDARHFHISTFRIMFHVAHSHLPTAMMKMQTVVIIQISHVAGGT
jgi:hypothetical protein